MALKENQIHQPQFESPSAEDFGEPGPAVQEGQSRSWRQVESQAGRKPGFDKRTAGAKSQATREALGGSEKKHGASAVEVKLTGPQKAGRQKRVAAKKRAVAQERRKRKSRRAA
jgi:hypothetical protein